MTPPGKARARLSPARGRGPVPRRRRRRRRLPLRRPRPRTGHDLVAPMSAPTTTDGTTSTGPGTTTTARRATSTHHGRCGTHHDRARRTPSTMRRRARPRRTTTAGSRPRRPATGDQRRRRAPPPTPTPHRRRCPVYDNRLAWVGIAWGADCPAASANGRGTATRYVAVVIDAQTGRSVLAYTSRSAPALRRRGPAAQRQPARASSSRCRGSRVGPASTAVRATMPACGTYFGWTDVTTRAPRRRSGAWRRTPFDPRCPATAAAPRSSTASCPGRRRRPRFPTPRSARSTASAPCRRTDARTASAPRVRVDVRPTWRGGGAR